MPRPVLDPVTEKARAALRASGIEASERLKDLQGALETFRWQHENAASPEGREDAAAECARLEAEVVAQRALREDLAARMFAFDLAVFEEHFPPTGPVLVDEEMLEAIAMLSGLVDHPDGRAAMWLSSQSAGPENVLALVDYMCARTLLPLPLMGVWTMSIPAQIRALGAAANLIGVDRIRAQAERRLSQWEGAGRSAKAALDRHAQLREREQIAPQIIRRRAQAEKTLKSSERAIERYANTVRYLTERVHSPAGV